MKNEYEAIGDLLLEMEESNKVNTVPEETTYTVTYDYGAFITLLCCNP